jgi:beta-lactam-binding protein with PASTA domain
MVVGRVIAGFSAAVAVLSAAGIAETNAQSAAAGQQVTLEPSQGPPGTTVVVTPIIFSTGQCSAAWDQDPGVTFACGPDANGLFQPAELPVPSTASPGPHTITVCAPPCGGIENGWVQSAPFTVLAIVPNLRSLDIRSATDQLTAADLQLGQVSGPSTDPAARITTQDPTPGTALNPNSFVNVTVEAPQQPPPSKPVTVPNLRGLTQARASALLSQNKLILQVTSGEGLVDSQDPPAGTSVSVGSTVAVILRAPPSSPTAPPSSPTGRPSSPTAPPSSLTSSPSQLVTVPDIRNQSADQARATLDGVGLALQLSGPARAGTVDRQHPDPGAQVPIGSTVTVTLHDVAIAPVSHTRGVPPALWAVVVAVIVLAVAALTRWLIRRRRPRSVKWARQHVRLVPQPDVGRVNVAETGPRPTRTFWLETHPDAGVQIFEELRR